MTTYLGNAFSLNMVEVGAKGVQADIQPMRPEDVPVDARSIIGHEDMAAIVAGILKREVVVDRETVLLHVGDVLYVAQYRGPRLPTGTTQLPAEASLEFYCVTLRRK